jgi:predicted ATPase/DNA-binding XRE family transcriptional regulator
MPLAELLQRHRAQAHLSQEELADRSGVSARTIGDIETGISLWPRAITVSLLAGALDLDGPSRDEFRAAASRRGLRRGGADLPAATQLVGRDADLKKIRALLGDPSGRLITLTGGPGVGKTALAIAIANELAVDFAGVLFIGFATLPDALLVPTKIALALGVKDVRGESVTASLASAIGDRTMLLVLDNFERVAGAAPVVGELLAAATNLRILVTSRVRLHLSGERALNVRPLSPSDSIHLLVEQLHAIEPEANASVDDPAIAALASAIGGVPLAIGLAAALLRTTSAAALAERLKHPLDALVAMRDAIASSYALLGADEQRLLRALTVFGGPFTEDDARRVASGTLRRIATLVDHNLVGMSEDAGGDAEFHLHPLINEFGAESLEREGESEAAHIRLAEYCTALTQASPKPEPFNDPTVAACRSRESAHFDAALGWLKASGHIDRALTLAIEIWPIWYRRGACAHGHAWICSLIATVSDGDHIDDALLADAHWAAAGLAQVAYLLDEAERHGAFVLRQKRKAGNRKAVASVLAGLGACASLKGEYATARTYFEEMLAIRRELGDGLDIARALLDFGSHASDEGKCEEANAKLEEALVLFRAAGRRMGESLTLGALALVAVRSGAARQAETLARDAMHIAETIGFDESARAARLVLSRALLELRRPEEAGRLALQVAAGDEKVSSADAALFRLIGAIEFRLGRPREAAQYLDAAGALPPLPVIPAADRTAHEALVAAVTQAVATGPSSA